MKQLNAVEAVLPYLANMTERPYIYTYTPPPSVAQTNRRVAPQAASIRDAQPIADPLSLDRNGFVLRRQESTVSNFYDEDEMGAVYSPECERRLQGATGAALAVCDARSLRQDDFVASDLIYPHRRGEIYALTFRPTHQWYYFPQMQPAEAVLLKCYDSTEEGRARFTAHTAFDDPTSPPEAAPRESIETRAFVFFGGRSLWQH